MNNPTYVLVPWPEAKQFVGCNEGTYPAERGCYFVVTELYDVAKANPNVNGEALEKILALKQTGESRML